MDECHSVSFDTVNWLQGIQNNFSFLKTRFISIIH